MIDARPLIGAALLLAPPAPEGPPPRAVVLSTDCGAEVDDQWALTHLARSPEIALKGVVTTHAPSLAKPAAESAAKSARSVLDRQGLAGKVPVIAGASGPLAKDGKPAETPAARFLIDAAKGYSVDRRLTVVMIGAATDVATALLLDPSWADRVEIVSMAFDAWPGGGDPWNVKNDVRAWQVVLASRVPLVVGDSACTRRDLTMTPALARSRFGGKGKGGDYLGEVLADWIARNPKLAEHQAGKAGAWPIWDEVAVAYLLGMTRQERKPRPSLRDDRTFDHTHPSGEITWVTSIDAEKLWDDLASKLR